MAVATLSAAPLVSAFFQVPDDPSPRSGTAQVIAQGVVTLPDGDVRWQVAERTAPPPANASPSPTNAGFIIGESGVILVEDVETGQQHRLPSGEAMLTRPGAEHIRAALGSEPAGYRDLTLVAVGDEAGADEPASFVSEPFPGPGAQHDLDLLSDVLGPGASLALPAGALPTLVLVRAGSADVATEAGDVFSLGAGEAVALSGPLAITAADNGAEVAAVYTGPAVPRLAQVAATPGSGSRVIESQNADAAADASPVAQMPAVAATVAAEPATDDLDDDGDGLTASQEIELNTDAALADTDEDGLTDGQEALEIGTAPLAPDTDGDGILDGDEVAQGTDPLDGVAGSILEEAPVDEGDGATEPPPAEEESPPVEQAPPGDTDGDGLEDAIELELGTDASDPDTDDDGALDGDEYYALQSGTRNPDTDGDGVLDGAEAANGTDPNDPDSF